jgi:hypothetical protein
VDASRVLLRRESKTEPPNYHVRALDVNAMLMPPCIFHSRFSKRRVLSGV